MQNRGAVRTMLLAICVAFIASVAAIENVNAEKSELLTCEVVDGACVSEDASVGVDPLSLLQTSLSIIEESRLGTVHRSKSQTSDAGSLNGASSTIADNKVAQPLFPDAPWKGFPEGCAGRSEPFGLHLVLPEDDHVRGNFPFPPICTEGSYNTARLYVVLFCLFSASCVIYEWSSRAAEAEAQRVQAEVQRSEDAENSRVQEWDFVKLCLVCGVVFTHVVEQAYNLPLTYWEQPVSYWSGPRGVTGLLIISGIFGHNIKSSALARVFCYSAGTIFFTAWLTNFVTLVTPGSKPLFFYFYEMWYIASVGIWRFTISPLFHAASAARVPTVVPFLLVCTISYVYRQTLMTKPFFGTQVPVQLIMTAPCFAFGLCFSTARWSAWLRDARLQAIAVSAIVAYSAILHWAPNHRDFFVSSIDEYSPPQFIFCDEEKKRACGVANFQSLSYCIQALMIKLAHSLCLIWTLGAFAQMLQRLAPRKISVVLECGTRTLHVYLLHYIFVVMASIRMGVPKLLPLPHFEAYAVPGAVEIAFVIFISALSTFVFSSRLSDLLFGWIVFPMWLLDVPDSVSGMFGWAIKKEAGEGEKASKASS